MPNVGQDSDFERVEDKSNSDVLIGTNVVSEARKRGKANGGVRRFFDEARQMKNEFT